MLTYNAFLMSTSLYPNWGQAHRAAEIPKTTFFRGNDVVVLQEAFDNASSDALTADASAQYPFHTPVVGRSRSGWDATSGSYSAATPEDGGVTVLSKWPIVRQEQHIYKDACGSDWWSNKGFAYAELNVNGARVHIVGTHTQSTDPGCGAGEAAEIRGKQFRQIDAFLDAKNIPASEQVIVAGDLNVDSHSPEYTSLLANAGLTGADARTGHPYSFDTQDNSIAADRYPDDPREDLDHVLHRAGHAKAGGVDERGDQGGQRALDRFQLGHGLHVHRPLRPLPGRRGRALAGPTDPAPHPGPAPTPPARRPRPAGRPWRRTGRGTRRGRYPWRTTTPPTY